MLFAKLSVLSILAYLVAAAIFEVSGMNEVGSKHLEPKVLYECCNPLRYRAHS